MFRLLCKKIIAILRSNILLNWTYGLYNNLLKNIVFLNLKINFVRASSADPDEMLHLGIHYLPKYPFCVSGPQRDQLALASFVNLAFVQIAFL